MTRAHRLDLVRQRGSTLVVALVFLVILGLLGVTVASTNTLQERMAGNTRNRDLAFQAAEHALQDAETQMNTDGSVLRSFILAHVAAGGGTSAPPAPSQPGYVRLNSAGVANDANYWRATFDWGNGATSHAPTNGLNAALIAAQPRYVVDYMGSTVTGAPPVTGHFYRITARGVGRSADSAVILQAMYRF